MANELVSVQHSCDRLLKFTLPKDTVTVDLEVMTLTGIHTLKKNKNNLEKMILPLEQRKYASSIIFGKGERDSKTRDKKLLSTLLNQDLEPNYRPKTLCSCSSFRLNRNQKEHNAPPTNTNNNTLTLVRMTLTYNRPRQQQKQKKVEMKSDWSPDSDNRRDNQARKPIRHKTTSDWETNIEDNQHILVEAPSRRPNTMPLVLTNGK